MKKRIVPIGSYLLVKKVGHEETQLESGLYLPDWRGESAQDFLVGEVLAVGDILSDEMMRWMVAHAEQKEHARPHEHFRVPKVGDKVLVNKFGLHEFQLDGESVYLPGLVNIAGIIEEESSGEKSGSD